MANKANITVTPQAALSVTSLPGATLLESEMSGPALLLVMVIVCLIAFFMGMRSTKKN